MNNPTDARYGFIKPAIDAHTMGLNMAAELLRDCGYEVIIADEAVAQALSECRHELRRKVVIDWIVLQGIDRLGISYRLDSDDALHMMGYLLEEMKRAGLMKFQGGPVAAIYFAGLPPTCAWMIKEFKGLVRTFTGGESPRETLNKLMVPGDRIPRYIYEGSAYDDSLLDFGQGIIDSQAYQHYQPADRLSYPELGTGKDSVTKRIKANMRDNFPPLTRAHLGPYSSGLSRREMVDEFLVGAAALAKSGYLDILSIGSSQLTQSNFGEDWGDQTNGGGVPVNSPEEYRMIWEACRPMLVRTYAGTKNIPALAQMHEQTLNICWHALSLWWFNLLDGRGPYDLYSNLKTHIDTIKYVARTGKPWEANVAHHFAFRGADDVTYVISAYLAAKLAKKLGIRTFILQNMLNTPRTTWGIQDLAKSRALLKLVRTLEDRDFRVLLQPRAGLDYFKPDLYQARIQLGAVTALMDDIEPYDQTSPPIIHVVSYSEAVQLATPEIIDESIKITQYSLQQYRARRRKGHIEDMGKNLGVIERTAALYERATQVISGIEANIADPYSPAGLYLTFAAGFLPVPYLWGEVEEFKHAKNWRTRPVRGSVNLVDDNNRVMEVQRIIETAKSNLPAAEYNLGQRIMKADQTVVDAR